MVVTLHLAAEIISGQLGGENTAQVRSAGRSVISDPAKTETRLTYVLPEKERQDGSRQLRQEDEEDEHEELRQEKGKSMFLFTAANRNDCRHLTNEIRPNNGNNKD